MRIDAMSGFVCHGSARAFASDELALGVRCMPNLSDVISPNMRETPRFWTMGEAFTER